MSNLKPKELWCRWNSKTSAWEFSFDPPLQRHVHRYVRMVPESALESLRQQLDAAEAQVKKLREALVEIECRRGGGKAAHGAWCCIRCAALAATNEEVKP